MSFLLFLLILFVCLLIQAIDLGVYLMNTNAPLPNGLKLGYVILDDCQKSRAATVQSLNFVRNITCSGKSVFDSHENLKLHLCN